MNIGVFQETKPVTGANKLVGAIYKQTAPTVIVGSPVIWTSPYTGQTQTHTFASLQAVVYIYICWESPDGSPTGTIRNQFEIQPNANTFNVRDDLYLTAGISPFIVSGGPGYGPDSSLPGWNWYIERVEQGTQNPNVQYIKTIAGVDTTIDDKNADGWRLAVPGDVVGENENFVIHFYPQLTATATETPSQIITSTNILSVNTALDMTAQGQSYWLRGSSGYFEVTLPDLGTVADNQPIYFMSSGGSHINASLKCFSGQQIEWYKNASDLASSTLASRIVLGQGERLALYRFTMPDSSKRWLVMFGGEGAQQVGEIVHSYSRIGLNYLFLDGTQGLSRTNYSRLWDFISSLDPSCVVSQAAWGSSSNVDGQSYNNNHGKFNTGDGSTTFGLPKIYEYGFLRAKSGNAGTASDGFPGDLNSLMLLTHKHDSFIGLVSGAPNGKGPSKSGGKYGGAVTTETDLSSIAYNVAAPNTTGTPVVRAGSENRPDNFGVYMSIRI